MLGLPVSIGVPTGLVGGHVGVSDARSIRRSMADWEFIERQPPRIREALKYYVETGDLYVASRIAGLRVEEFNELRIKARVPNIA